MSNDDVSIEAVEAALREAASSLTEQLTALDESISYHEGRARELRDTRKRVARVEAIVNAPSNGSGPESAAARAAVSERTKRRHAEEREQKKTRVREYVLALPYGSEVAGGDVAAALTDSSKAKNDPARLGTQLANALLGELRDEGTLRLDRVGPGKQAWYRVVGT